MLDQILVRLDSSCGHEATWNLAPSRPRMLLRWDGGDRSAILTGPAGVVRSWQQPLSALAWMESSITRGEFGPDARWVGYLSYDLGGLFENMPDRAADDLGLPLFVWALVTSADSCIEGGPAKSERGGRGSCRAAAWSPKLATARREPRPPEWDSCAITSTLTRDEYLRAIGRAIEYIRAGDVFQVNLSQRLTAALSDSAAEVYERLLQLTPARYGGLLDFGDHALICNSPELFLRVSRDRRTGRGRVLTSPIKGTRPRRPGMEAELRKSAKDQAELNMIVDLERNDLGRVCEIGSVRVIDPRTIETHPTVYHGSATIEGTLREGVTLVDLLRATFPGGSVTGAPKIRAMQIIDELEPVRRGPYCGAIGYLAADGMIELNVAIRTIIAKAGLAHVPVGGGIVADSDPAAEYDETLVKAQAMLAALCL